LNHRSNESVVAQKGTAMKSAPSPHPVSRRGIAVALACGVPTALLARFAHAAASNPAQAAMLKLEAAHLDAWNRHDAGAIAASFHTDGVRWTVSNPAGARGAAILAEVRAVFDLYPDFGVEVGRVELIDDRRLVRQLVFKGTWRGRFPGGPFATKEPSGRSFTTPAVELVEVRDALIVSSHVYFDRLSLLMQIGAIAL
jgi:ketosteroid isomerase-like protein